MSRAAIFFAISASMMLIGVETYCLAQTDEGPPQPRPRPTISHHPPNSAHTLAQRSVDEIMESATQIDPGEAQELTVNLTLALNDCSRAIETILGFEPSIGLEAGKCPDSEIEKRRLLIQQATDAADLCPFDQLQTLRRRVDEAIRELERKQKTTFTPEAKKIFADRISAYTRDGDMLDMAVKRAADYQQLLSNKLATLRAVIRACEDVARGISEPVADHGILQEAAKDEGELNLVGLPRTWCGYGKLIDGFEQKYGLKVNEIHPNANSKEQIDAIRASVANEEDNFSPDVVEISFYHGAQAKQSGFIQPYRVSTWDSIPMEAKDPDAYWYADYFSVIVFAINLEIIDELPEDWPDLLSPKYKRAVSLAGDPRRTNEAIMAVVSAGHSMTKGNTSLAGEAGLRFFAELSRAGNLVEVAGNALSLAERTTPIVIRWDYSALFDRDKLDRNPPVEVVVPRTGVVATPYVQAISAYAPHPNAAKLWMEFLYSDEGQLNFLNAYCHPIRYQDLAEHGKVPADLESRLPPPGAYRNIVFPDPEELGEARNAIFTGWHRYVGFQFQ